MSTETKHLPAAALRAASRAPGRARPAAERHLGACRSCRDEVALLRALAFARPPARVSPCPGADTLVALAGTASPAGAGRESLARHLRQCFSCAAEVDILRRAGREVERLPGPPGPPNRLARAINAIADRLRALVSFDMPMRLELATRGGGATGAGPDYRRGMAAYRAGRFGEARDAFGRADRSGRGRPDLPFYLGVCLLNAGAGDEAVERLRTAVKTEPELGEYRWYLAQALLATGRGKEALAELKRAARLPGPYAAPAHDLAARVASVIKE